MNDETSPDPQKAAGESLPADRSVPGELPGAATTTDQRTGAPDEAPAAQSPNALVAPGLAPVEQPGGKHEGVEPLPGWAGEAEDAAGDLDSERITFTFKRSHFYSVLVPVAFVLGLSVGYLFWGRSETAPQAAPAAQVQEPASSAEGAVAAVPTQAAAEGPRRYDIPVDDDPVLGPDDAPITIVEFSDYECPYCQRFHVETFARLIDAYPGQIRFVYRDFPLNQIHPNAIPAAEAANCAREQGAFWEYHDLLFTGSEGLGQEAYLSYALRLGLDQEAFAACIEARTYQEEVQADFDFAARLGVRSTPTFFINGLPLIGAQPFDVFKQVLDQELAGEIP